MIHNMAGGGAGVKLPGIYVTYPSGSTCTCTNGTKTYTAKGTSGGWFFSGLAVGTWTVKTTNGTQTTSKSVSITSATQGVSVGLTYRVDIIKAGVLQTTDYSLYKATASTASGVWTITGESAAHFAANFVFQSAYIGGTVVVEVTAGKGLVTSGYTSGILLNTSPVSAGGTPGYVSQTIFKASGSTITAGTYRLEIPEGFTSGYISIHAEPDINGYIKISNMWVE